MITHLLDTNVIGYFARQQFPPLSLRLKQGLVDQTVAISVITRAESMYGLELLDPNDKRRVQIPALLSDLTTIAWDTKHADLFAKIHADLVRRGQTIGLLDTMIAAHALAENLTLVTHNTKHFERIAGLRLEDWTA